MKSLPTDAPEVYEKFMKGYHVVRRTDRYWGGLSTDLIIEQVLMRSVKTTGGLTRGRGFTEAQRLVWLLSMPACAEVNHAMQKFTETSYETSEQHKDTRKSRLERDDADTVIVLSVLKDNNPFASDPSLRNIINGVVADKTVNADDAKSVGQKILDKMTGVQVSEFSFTLKDEVITLEHKHFIKIGDETLRIPPEFMFQKFLVNGNNFSDEGLRDLLQYELLVYPPALCESRWILRSPDKPNLAEAIEKVAPKNAVKLSEDAAHVLDGGSLVQRIPWPKKISYNKLTDIYIDDVKRIHEDAKTVFDGYSNEPSTKDNTHKKRTAGKIGPTINFKPEMIVPLQKKDFLNNTSNKQRFVDLLSDRLQERGLETKHAANDADQLIVSETLESAKTKDTVLIGEDTDLLVLLIQNTGPESKDVYFRSEKKNVKSNKAPWDIKHTQNMLGPELCRIICVIHAILGCDTTSAIFNVGKGTALIKAKDDVALRNLLAKFLVSSATQDDIINAGESALVKLLGGKPGQSLNDLRYKKFCERVTNGKSFVEPKSLPPTSAAAAQHSLRVYYQVQEWVNPSNTLDPTDWGWFISDNTLNPVMTTLPAAPIELLDKVRCQCKTGCKTRCSCRRNGKECHRACKTCMGSTCENAPKIDMEVDDI